MGKKIKRYDIQKEVIVNPQTQLSSITIDKSDKKFTHMFHLADIHIRKNGDMREVYLVFNNLYKDLIEQSKKANCVLVICGDIVDKRCQLDDLAADLFYNFFQSLVDIMDIIVIPGNHDCSISKGVKREGL